MRLQGHVLGPPSETRTIRSRAGEMMVGDGPVSEQTVQIAEFYILECADLGEAREVAAKNPGGELRHLGVETHRTLRA